MISTEKALAKFRQHSISTRYAVLDTLAYGADVEDVPFGSSKGNCLEDLINLIVSIGAPLTDELCLCGPSATDVRELHCGKCGGVHEEELAICEACSGAYPIDNMVYSSEDSICLCQNCLPQEDETISTS